MNLEEIKAQAAQFFDQGVDAYKQDDFDQAHQFLQQALTLYKNPLCLNIPELDPDRDKITANLASVLNSKGDYDQAIIYYQQALQGYQSDYCRNRPELDPDRALTTMNLATALNSKGDFDQAITYYQQALQGYQSNYCHNRPELDRDRARTAMNLAVALDSKGDYDQAIKYNQQALQGYQSDYCRNRPELDPSRARTAMNLASTLEQKGDSDQAITYYQQALQGYQSDYCRNRPELDPSRARTAMNLANTLYKKGSFDQALSYYQQAEKLYQGKTIPFYLPLNDDRCALYANMSNLFHNPPQPLIWAKKTSQHLIQLLACSPALEHAGGAGKIWQEMHCNFEFFHLNWLKYALKQRAYTELPLILFALQGRELMAEFLNKASLKQDLASPIKDYLKLKQQLLVLQNQPQQNTGQYQEYYQKMLKARKKAGQVAGYELLPHYHLPFGLADLQQSLKAHEAIALMVDIRDIQGVLLIFQKNKPLWIEIPQLWHLAQKLDAFNETNRLYQQQLREITQTTAYRHLKQANIIRKPKPSQAFIDSELLLDLSAYYSFWSEYTEQFKGDFWDRVSPYLDNIQQLSILSSNRLHELPFAVAQPKNIRLNYYAGLFNYGLKKGFIQSAKTAIEPLEISYLSEAVIYPIKHVEIYHGIVVDAVKAGLMSIEKPSQATTPVIPYQGVAFLAYAASLPAVDQEISQLQQLYQQQDQACEVVQYPLYPNENKAYELLHFSGHGGVDPLNPYSTALLVGQNHYLTTTQVLTGKTKVKHVFLNSCTVGRVQENIQGTPNSLAVSLLEHPETQTVTSSTQPIMDDLALEFSHLWHQNWLTALDKNPTVILEQTKEQFTHHWFVNNKQRLIQTLNKEILNQGEITPNIRCYIELSYGLNRQEEAELEAIIKLNTDGISQIIDFLTKIGRFDDQHVPPQLGCFLYGFRVYGG